MSHATNIQFIVNPKSGRGLDHHLPDLIREIIDKKIIHYDIVFSKERGDIKNLAANAVKADFDIVVVAGGDGTVNEGASAVAGTGKVLGIIPIGSGNGLARELQIPMNIGKSIGLINRLKIKKIDGGMVNGNPFFVAAGLGFDSHIAKLFTASTTRGFSGYLKIFAREFLRYTPRKYSIRLDGVNHSIEAFAVCVANGRQYGNNAFIAPEAVLDDGLLDLVVIKPFPKIAVPGLAVKFFRGTLHKSRYFESMKIQETEIIEHSDDCYHMDGEYCVLDGKLHFQVKPGSLLTLIP